MPRTAPHSFTYDHKRSDAFLGHDVAIAITGNLWQLRVSSDSNRFFTIGSQEALKSALIGELTAKLEHSVEFLGGIHHKLRTQNFIPAKRVKLDDDLDDDPPTKIDDYIAVAANTSLRIAQQRRVIEALKEGREVEKGQSAY